MNKLNKMRKALALCLSILILSVCATPAYAHSGRTDSAGGHTDKDTGEYHYHHGYSAHDHYDMDGDGDIDCPYDYDSKTGNSSWNNRNHDPHTNNSIQSEIPKIKPAPNNPSLWDIITVIFSYLPGAIALWLLSSYFLFYILGLFFGDDQGCSASMIVGAVISLALYIWSIIATFS